MENFENFEDPIIQNFQQGPSFQFVFVIKFQSCALLFSGHCTFSANGVLFQSQKAVSVIIARKLRVLTEKVAEQSRESGKKCRIKVCKYLKMFKNSSNWEVC